MKKAQKLQDEISRLITEIEEEKRSKDGKKTVVNRLKKRKEFVITCLRYIQTGPTKDFLEKEQQRLSNRINMFMEGYIPLDPEVHLKSECTKHRKAFEKDMDIPKLRKQLTTINFLLN